MADAAHIAERRRPFLRSVLFIPAARSTGASEVIRFVFALAAALAGFGLLLIIQGRNPLATYADMFGTTLGSAYGRSEVLVVMIPVLLCALAVAVPARVGLVNVGGEGQLYMGAWAASWAALSLNNLPALAMLPVMLLMGMVGG